MLVVLNGWAYCEAKLAAGSRSTDVQWSLDVSKPVLAGLDAIRIELEDEGARIPVTLVKPSSAADDLRIVVATGR